jgi:murein DD-endopeptidase MepM/ murein hydrolase activator NlpD
MPLPTTEGDWDWQTGDGAHFDNDLRTPAVMTGIRDADPELKQLSRDFSTKLLGFAATMTTGYAYDVTVGKQLYEPQKPGGRSHAGIDYGVAAGNRVLGVVPGWVEKIDNQGTNGSFVAIRGNDGRRWVYGHIQPSTSIKEGSTISEGQQIGTIYNQGGNSHLHVEVQTSLDTNIV